jgi:hypothetical protein
MASAIRKLRSGIQSDFKFFRKRFGRFRLSEARTSDGPEQLTTREHGFCV